MHRPMKGESQSVAKMRAEYQVGPTGDRYVYSPSKPMGDPGVEKITTLGIGLPCFNYVHSLRV
jgi:hypothetical protein